MRPRSVWSKPRLIRKGSGQWREHAQHEKKEDEAKPVRLAGRTGILSELGEHAKMIRDAPYMGSPFDEEGACLVILRR